MVFNALIKMKTRIYAAPAVKGFILITALLDLYVQMYVTIYLAVTRSHFIRYVGLGISRN